MTKKTVRNIVIFVNPFCAIFSVVSCWKQNCWNRCSAHHIFASSGLQMSVSFCYVIVHNKNAAYFYYHIPTSSFQWWLTAQLMHELMVLQILVHPAGNETMSSFLNPLVCRAYSPSSLRHSALLQKGWMSTSLTISWFTVTVKYFPKINW